METTTKENIIVAAVIASGPQGDDPGEWRTRLGATIASITAMMDPDSDAMRIIDSVAGAKIFPATIVKVEKEKSSTRGLVSLKTRPSDRNPDGVESARTERTDSERGRAMARRLRALIGHKVLVYIDLQKMASGSSTVRVIAHVEDLGVDEDVAQELGLKVIG
jgi:hypothetical protein